MGLVNKSEVKKFIRENNSQRISTDTYDALNKLVEQILMKANERAIQNGRTTIKGVDI